MKLATIGQYLKAGQNNLTLCKFGMASGEKRPNLVTKIINI